LRESPGGVGAFCLSMQLGKHLRELWQLRIGVVVSVALASLAALWSVGSIGLLPPSFTPRQLEISTASTRALVDTPQSTVLDLDVNTYGFTAITNRALLVGNIMGSTPVRAYIARRAHLPADQLRITTPVTVDYPRPLASAGKRSTRDILKSPDEYRLNIQANPTVPIVDVYATAPTPEQAQQLANGAIDGMKDYLRDLAVVQQIKPAKQVHLEQLGRAKGGIIDPGISVKFAALSFFLVLAASSALSLFVVRIRRGWALEAQQERLRDLAPVGPRER
jgi:hypothetical protein